MTSAAVALTVVTLLIVLGVAIALCDYEDRGTIAILICFGFVLSLGKIFFFQHAPQWRDINPDSVTYDLNARAFARHWRGDVVNVDDYALHGLAGAFKSGAHGQYWLPGEDVPYTLVIGSGDWLYTAYLGLYYFFAGVSHVPIYISQAALAAFFPAAAFGICLALGTSRRVALFGAALALIDPSSGVNASWLLKDTLVGFLAMAALWAAVAYAREHRILSVIILTISLALLGNSRFAAYLALVTGLVFGALLLMRSRVWKPAISIAVAILLATVVLERLYSLPQFVLTLHPSVTVNNTIEGGLYALRAPHDSPDATGAVTDWKVLAARDFSLALVKLVARNLFAPYPWGHALHPGLTWRSSIELYYPGMLLWICCLPGIFVAVYSSFHRIDARNNLASWIVLVFLGSLIVMYTIYYGGLSGRQRVFVLPAFFALSAVGWAAIARRWRTKIKAQ